MSEVKDPKIKLFGKTIELPDASVPAAAAAVAVAVAAEASGEVSAQPCEVGGEDSSNQDPPCSPDSIIEDSNLNRGAEEQESSKSPTSPKQDHTNEEDGSQPLTSEDIKDSNTTLPMIEDSNNTPSADSDGGSVKTSKPAEDQGETDNSGEKTLKKPDKILQCPRCNSMDTKFCYFNNYNVNQPRHFCKNCQRYWTAGGTMRNVPVGAGRRKNKNSISQFRHQTVPEALSNGIHHPALNPNGTVLTFSSDAPLCESMVSALNIVDKTIINGSTSKPEDKGDDGAKEETGRTGLPSTCNLFPPCYPGAPPWPYPYLVQWGPGSFPVPFYSTALPPPYLGCALPGPWSVPWVIPPTPTSSGPTSPTIGKHSRDENVNPKVVDAKEVEMRKESDSENKCLWVPKTLRIDDPGEAAKSSIWATLGIKDGRSETVGGGGRFKAFERQTKGDEKKKVLEPSIVLQANPAALSRSVNFHESS